MVTLYINIKTKGVKWNTERLSYSSPPYYFQMKGDDYFIIVLNNLLFMFQLNDAKICRRLTRYNNTGKSVIN